MAKATPISADTVRADFNDPVAVVHYARAAHHLGLWRSERLLFERHLPLDSEILEAGCGAGRVTIGLHDHGYTALTAFDFAEELVEQARSLFAQRGATDITVHHADATRLDVCAALQGRIFDAVLFMFNGMMQIPGRENRRTAMRQLFQRARPGATFIFTTHDRDHSRLEKAMWTLEAHRWAEGKQDPRLLEFGDRYFEEDEVGRTFMHLPDRQEILDDLASAGWQHVADHMRRELARETKLVTDFSDECRFWVARRPA